MVGQVTVRHTPHCIHTKLSTFFHSATTLHNKEGPFWVLIGSQPVGKDVARALGFNFMPGLPKCILFLSVYPREGAKLL